jgi:phosphatidylserine decarboxylase
MIASDGLRFIIPAWLVTALFLVVGLRTGAAILFVLAALAMLTAIFMTYFFRDPERTPPEGDELILSPGDGKIIVSETHKDESGHEFKLVSIFLSVFDVHINRIPISGEVTRVRHVPGMFHRAFEPDALIENERTEITINSAYGEVSFSQVAGILARRIVCGLTQGEQVKRGERFGLIRFGSRVDIFLQPEVDVQVKLGDKVSGGVSVIGRYPQAR